MKKNSSYLIQEHRDQTIIHTENRRSYLSLRSNRIKTRLWIQEIMHFIDRHKEHIEHRSRLWTFWLRQMLWHYQFLLIYSRVNETLKRVSTTLFKVSNLSNSKTQILWLIAINTHFESFISHNNNRFHLDTVRHWQIWLRNVHYLQILKANMLNSRKNQLKSKRLSADITLSFENNELRIIQSNHIK
jgi:hypothetical protein